MDVTEKWGDDIESAVKLALVDLKCSREDVEVEVLEQPSRGFFGIGSKLALVRVSKKKAEPVIEEPVIEEAPEETPSAEEPVQAEELKAAQEPKEKKPQESRRNRKRNRKDKKKTQKTIEERNPKLDELDFHKTMDHLPIMEEHPALDFLKDVTEQMGLKVNMVLRADEKNVYVNIEGADSGTIIGKRGQTLDAIQYLTSLVVNKDQNEYIKVVVDAENYRSRREKTLEQLASKLAGKVIRSRRPVRLEPMNPYERKVIHATLQNNPKVTTRSEGQDPYRRVIIELK